MADRPGVMIRRRQGGAGSWWHVRGAAAITAKGQFEGINPLNWPLVLCPRQERTCDTRFRSSIGQAGWASGRGSEFPSELLKATAVRGR
jgi:hypothetical protein